MPFPFARLANTHTHTHTYTYFHAHHQPQFTSNYDSLGSHGGWLPKTKPAMDYCSTKRATTSYYATLRSRFYLLSASTAEQTDGSQELHHIILEHPNDRLTNVVGYLLYATANVLHIFFFLPLASCTVRQYDRQAGLLGRKPHSLFYHFLHTAV